MILGPTLMALVFWGAAAILFYTLVFYPGLLLFAGQRRSTARTSVATRHDLPSVTLIIPAHNEEAVLRQKLENSLRLEYPPDRLAILVASDGSTDDTVSIARAFSCRDRRVQVFATTCNRGKAAILNCAIEHASTDLICLCDANVFFRSDALRVLVERMRDDRVGAASGDVRLLSADSNFGQGESFYYGVERAIHAGESVIGSMMGVDGGMYLLRRDLFSPIAEDTILDDFVISMKVIRRGFRIAYVAQAVAEENGTPASREEFRRRVRVAAGAAQVLKRRQWPPLSRPVELWQFVSHKLLRWFSPVWLVLLFLSSAALWNEGLVYRAVFAGQVGFYVIAALAALSVRFRKTKVGGVAFYFTMSQIALAIGMIKGLFWKQTGRWKRTARTPLPNAPVP